MAARSTWTGAINFAGFPIHLAAYNITKSKSADSFKSLCECHSLPIVQNKFCSVDGARVVRSGEAPGTPDQHGQPLIDVQKGVEVSSGKFVVLADDALEFIETKARTETAEVERFAPLDSVPLVLATGAYRFIANPKVPGSEGPVGILWNGLRASGRGAVIPDWSPRASSRPTTLVIHADETGLIGNTMPYGTDLADVPKATPDVNEQAAQMFEQFVEMNYSTDAFDLIAYTDAYAQRRAEAIEKALNGEIIEATEAAPQAQAAPDLMAAMEAALGAGSAPAPKKKAAAKKPKAGAAT